MRPPTIRHCLVLVGLMLLATPAQAQQQARGDRNSLTRADLDEAGVAVMTARDAVRVLRSQWLTPPMGRKASSDIIGAGGGSQLIIVYIDDMRQNDIEALATVPAAKIFSMKYLDQNRAVVLHGPGHEAGVIEVTTVDKRK